MTAIHQEVLEQLGTQFSLALEGMLGERWPVELKELKPPSVAAEVLCWSQRLSMGKDPALQVATYHASWQDVGKKALAAVGIEDPAEADVRATYLELLTQALSGLARFLTAKLGREVSLESGEEIPLPIAGASVFLGLVLSSPSGASIELLVRVDPTLLQALQPPPEEAASTPAKGETPQQQKAAAAMHPPAQTPVATTPAMDLLLDVQMPVSVSFGRTQLQLKEVIKLSTGSIIELNRTVNEPVDVIVNNCIVARGEVVVIEGNYGVRIHQIVSRAERLRTFD